MIREKSFHVKFEEYKDFFLCTMEPIPILGKGPSPQAALMSLVESIDNVYDYWAKGLNEGHVVRDTNPLAVYKELTFMVTNKSDHKNQASFYTPIKNDE